MENNNLGDLNNPNVNNDLTKERTQSAPLTNGQRCTKFLKARCNKGYAMQGVKDKWRHFALFFGIIAIVLVLDLVLKSVFDGTTHKFIDGFISIDGFAHNTGAAFSMFSNATVALLIFSIIFVLGFIAFEYLTMDKKRGYTYYVAVALIIGGTIGNLVDRLAFGYVRDFIKLEFMDFPIFNIADCALTVGVIVLAVWMLFIDVKHSKPVKSEGKSEE